MGERLRKSTEDPEVIEALYAIKKKKRKQQIEDEIECAASKEIYYK